jgi:hypothetical protein
VHWNWLLPLDYTWQDNINVDREEMCRCETTDLAIFGSDIESCVLEGHGIYQLKRISRRRRAWWISIIGFNHLVVPFPTKNFGWSPAG